MTKRFGLTLGTALITVLIAASPGAAKSKSSGGGHATSTRSTSSKSLPAGTHFVRKTCKTAACKAKHPSGSYMLPIKPKKRG